MNWTSANRCFLAVYLLMHLSCCSGCGKVNATVLLPKNQESAGELDIFRRPLQSNDFVRTPREDDPVQPLRWVDMGTSATNVVAIRQDGRQAVVRTATQTIVYDLVDRKHLHEWNEVFRQAKFTADGKILATIGENEISLWNPQTFQSKVQILGKPLSRQDPHFSHERRIAIDPKSEQIVVSNHLQGFDASLPAGLLIYSTRDGRFKRSIEFSFECTPTDLQFLLDGKRILCSYSKGKYHYSSDWHAVFDTTTGSELATFNLDDLRIAVSPDGLSFATGKCADIRPLARVSLEGPTTLKVYDAETLRVKRVFDYPLTARRFTFSPDSRRILVAYGDPGKSEAQLEQSGHLIEWEVDSGRKSFSAINEHKTFASVAYSPSGNRRFATTEAPNGVDDDVSRWLHGWETDSGQALKIEPYEVNYNGWERLMFFPRGEVFVDADSDEPFAVKNVLNGEAVLTLPNYRRDATDAEFMPGDDKFIAFSDHFGSVITDVSSGRQRRWLAKRRPSFFNAGRNLFSQYPLEIVDVLSGKSQWRLTLNGLATISRDGKWIVVASCARIVLIEVSRPFQPRIVSVCASALAFHPDSQRFLAASANAIEEYEVASGKRLRTLWNPPGRATDMTYSNDGKSILICGVLGHQEHKQPVDAPDEGWAAIVQASSGNNVDLIGHTAPVTCVAFSETADLVATGSMDHTVRVWNSAGNLLATFSAHRAPITDVTFNSGTSLLLSTARDGAALWDVSSITEPVHPSPSVADSFQVVENLMDPHGHPIEADLTKEGFFEDLSTIRNLGPTAEIEVQKESWNLIRVGRLKDSNSGNKDHPRWLDLASSETRIIVNAKELKNRGFPNRPQNYDLLDTSFDRSQAVFASRKEQKIEVIRENGESIQRLTFPKSPQNSPSIGARLSPSKMMLVVEATLGSDGKQLDVYDVATAAHKYTLGGFHSRFSTCFHIDPLERTLLVKTTETARPYALVLYDLGDGRQIASREVLEHTNTDYSMAGHYIIERPLERTEVKLVNPLTLDVVRTFKCDSPVRFVQTTHDGKRLLVGQEYVNETYLMSCWDVESGEPLWSKVGSAGTDGIFSPTGKYYLCGNRNLWTLWEMESGEVQCVVSFDIETQRLPQEGAIFSSRGDALFLGSVDGPLLWSERK